MANKSVDPNAKAALNQMKLEIANELNISNNMGGAEHTSHENGVIGGRVGGHMSRRLVEMGEELLIKQYNNKINN